MSSSITQQLVEMGFPLETASAAAGNNRNMDQALTFIQTGGEGFDNNVADSGASESSTTDEAAATSSMPAVAKGFKCDECGTLLANDQAIMDHANKTKHSKFSQSTETKTDEEAKIKQVFDQILAGQKQKKQEKEKPVEAESRALQTAQEEQRERDIKEYAEQRRRQKAADDVHRKKILEQIKLDQEERKERAQKAVQKVETPVVKKGVEEGYTMLQIRLPDGKTVKQMFQEHEQLVMVRAWVETNHSLPTEFKLMTPFPRKEFTDDEMGTTLKDLNLVPSANIVVVNLTPPPAAPAEFKVPYPPQVNEMEDSELD